MINGVSFYQLNRRDDQRADLLEERFARSLAGRAQQMKLASLVLAAGIAPHEIRNPLSSIESHAATRRSQEGTGLPRTTPDLISQDQVKRMVCGLRASCKLSRRRQAEPRQLGLKVAWRFVDESGRGEQ